MGILGSIARFSGKILSLGTSQMKCGAHVTRYFMYRKLSTVLNDGSRGLGKKVLAISHSTQLAVIMGIDLAEIIEANYPEHNAIDLRAFANEEFDYIISDQVLEHVEGDPQSVFSESLRVLKPGGIAVHTTCFINPIHGWPSDFWRFTPDCLALLARDFSEIIDFGGFGNRAIWILDALGLRYSPIPNASWHPLNRIATTNEPNWPVSTWIVARR